MKPTTSPLGAVMAPPWPRRPLGFKVPPELPVSQVFATHVTRRRIIIGTATLAAGGAGLALGSGQAGAQADVELGDLDVQDGELSPADGEVYAPWLLITGDWKYRVEVEPAEWQAYCLIGDGSGNTEAIGVTSGDASAREAAGTYALRGAITAASFYGPEDFRVPDGGDSVSVSVPVEIAFVVRDGDGGMLVQARVDDTAVVTVTPGGTMASLSGSGEVVMQDDAGDPEPEV